MNRLVRLLFPLLLTSLFLNPLQSQGNRPERLEWFQDLGYGLFIHWGVDSQIGSVISHSLVGASDDYLHRYFEELPPNFNPESFNPEAWARLARAAGIRYFVFTTKHHSGFSMFHTETTDFGIQSTPFGRDVTGELVQAFRRQGIAVGFYFSPDDFHFLYRQGTTISRRRPEAQPVNNPTLMEHNRKQLRELLTRYGPIDILFIDGPPEGLLELAWEIRPEIVITRGALETPEISPSTRQGLPEVSSDNPWEACFTLGSSWQYKPTNERYEPGSHWIQSLIETRAKGGNMLLNIGPTPEGEIPLDQAGILREIGLWLLVNGEAVYGVRPAAVVREGDTWFTRKKDSDTVYAFVTGEGWPWGEERSLTIESFRATEQTRISLLGQSGRVLEYQPDVVPETTWQQDESGLHIHATRAQRLYNDRSWANPVVFRITHAEAVE